jgi:hypothetical protein
VRERQLAASIASDSSVGGSHISIFAIAGGAGPFGFSVTSARSRSIRPHT